jgi:hypothetical protein
MDSMERSSYVRLGLYASFGSDGKIIIEDKHCNRTIVYDPKKYRPIFNDKQVVIFDIDAEIFVVDVDRESEVCSVVNYFTKEESEDLLEMMENIKKVISEEYRKKEEKTLEETAKTKKLKPDQIGEEIKDRIEGLYAGQLVETTRGSLLKYFFEYDEKDGFPKKPEKYLKKLAKELRKIDNLPAP